ncbi:MAG TPA: D-alanine--poly(phosphoribitol) ligase [Eggerthellaceae bacterium]|nr:D-alanine--poly(phosphoribitol) ligase [Eggerthellaceae bacterium]
MKNVLEWLENSARRTPDALAFADVESQLSYGQLLDRARAVGSFVQRHVRPCTPVAFYLEKSTVAVTGMLGAVYARCAYCVLDIRQPVERLAGILGTLAPGLVLADASCADDARALCTSLGLQVAVIQELADGPVDDAALASLRAQALDIDPLYINFTSGSTGVPKGVAVCHRSIIDFMGAFVDLLGITAEDRIANQAPFDFDVSVKDIYGALYTGASVHLVPRDYFSTPVKLMDFLAERRVTICTWAVSALCFVSIMGGLEYRVPETIRRVSFSGEVMPPKHLATWRSYLPDAVYVNLYGPTEITCNCTYFTVERDYGTDEVIPMGRAFDNEHVFLLDENDREVRDPGVEGEICVAGTALALGYYNDPERTAAAFVDNPLVSAYPQRMYRTGDIGAYDADGNLVYIARRDNQIKHLGQRIELGEIEAAAHGVEGVLRACCLYDARKKRILLFYAGACGKDDVLAQLREKLPQYMVPNKLFQLEELPLNKNGKIDRAALKEIGRIK